MTFIHQNVMTALTWTLFNQQSTSFYFPEEKKGSGFWSSFMKHPKTKHSLSLIRFFVFRVILPSMDISTDVQTAQSFFNQSHFYWGFSTLALVFLPFVARLLILLFQVAKIVGKEKDPDAPSKWLHIKWSIQRSLILWHLPPFNILGLVLYGLSCS